MNVDDIEWVDHPNPFGLIDSFDRRRREYKRLGWIYIMRNPAFKEQLFKIGKTRRPPMQRAQELGAATSVPEGFELIYFVHVSDHHEAEKLVHRQLARFRKVSNKEFFDVPLAKAVWTLDDVARRFPLMVGWRPPKALAQYFKTFAINCNICGVPNRVHQLAVRVDVKCQACGANLL